VSEADCRRIAFAFEQRTVYLKFPAVGVTTRVPLRASAPDHAPPAVQAVALLEDQVIVTDAPSKIELAEISSFTVG
jgi:hypothetical protein